MRLNSETTGNKMILALIFAITAIFTSTASADGTLDPTFGAGGLVQTNFGGFYRFSEVASGQTYVLTINSKRSSFDPPTRIVNVADTSSDLNFTAN
jgi:hypothetical protein